MKGAFYTGQYRNVFAELGHSQEEIDQKLKDAFHTVFYGPDDEKFYFEAGDDMGYFEDTGNFDARTEGMSYAMMMCVQMDMKNEFDRVWKWARTYMYMEDGYNKGYFAWSCKTTGEKNDLGPAPDGEEFFAMALFFASHRWGDGEGIFNYSQEARNILSACIHNGEKEPGDPIMEPENYLIRFIPSRKFSDPSYHCAHFYELFSMWANEEDRPFWKKAAKASREYLKKACHKDTGLAAEYAYYDGTPYEKEQDVFGGRHDWYYSDSYRVIANIGLDYEWFAADEWNVENNNKVQKFFCETHKDEEFKIYEIDGTVIEQPALHPVAMIATNAQASLAANGPYAKESLALTVPWSLLPLSQYSNLFCCISSRLWSRYLSWCFCRCLSWRFCWCLSRCFCNNSTWRFRCFRHLRSLWRFGRFWCLRSLWCFCSLWCSRCTNRFLSRSWSNCLNRFWFINREIHRIDITFLSIIFNFHPFFLLQTRESQFCRCRNFCHNTCRQRRFGTHINSRCRITFRCLCQFLIHLCIGIIFTNHRISIRCLCWLRTFSYRNSTVRYSRSISLFICNRIMIKESNRNIIANSNH